MPSQRRRKKRMGYLLIANVVLFVSTLVISSAASLIVLNPKRVHENVAQETYRQIHTEVSSKMDAKFSNLLHQAKVTIEQKNAALEKIREEFLTGYVVSKDIEVTDRNQATWLAEPKLMLGVNSLPGGAIKITFAEQSRFVSVGERIDFKYQDCDCFLLLKSSVFGSAKFRFACTPTTIVERDEKFVEARLN